MKPNEAKHTPTLSIGFYVPTEKFKAIMEHIAICESNGALVALTGPSDDPRSKETAESFLIAVNSHEALLEALKDLLRQIETNGERTEFVVGSAVHAIAQAEGKAS